MQQAIDKIIHDSKCLHSTPMGIMVTEFFEKRLQALPDGWILMSEKTPSEWGEYIVYCHVDGMTTREWDSDQNIWINGDRESLYTLEEITHWKPLGPLPITS